jgi:hypothetical protein
MPPRAHCSVLPYLAAAALFFPVAIGAQEPSPEPGESIVIHGPPPPAPPAVIARDEAGRVTIRASRVEEPILLDGMLDEAVYSRIPAMSDFVQQEPREGEPATERTRLVLFDDERLRERALQDSTRRMVINEMRRDNFNIFQNGNVPWCSTRSTGGTGSSSDQSPRGPADRAVGDEADQQPGLEYGLERGSRLRPGWTVEIAIPFKSLRYRAARPDLELQPEALHPLESERRSCRRSRPHRSRGIYKFSEAAILVGIEVPSGRATGDQACRLPSM